MIVTIIVVACLIVGVTVVEFASAFFQQRKNEGPWIVEKGDAYLAFNSPQEYTFSSVLGHANRFETEQDAQNWALITKGHVVPLAWRNP